MELNSRHKAFLAVAGVGVGALLVDKLILGSGSPAPAQASSGAGPVQPPPIPPIPTRGSTPSAVDRLEQLAQSQRVDPASVAPPSTPAVRPFPTGSGSVVGQSAFVSGSSVQGLRLTGIAPSQGVALINGHALKVGVENASLPGVKLVSVQAPTRAHKGSAVVEVSGQTRTLELSSGNGSNAR